MWQLGTTLEEDAKIPFMYYCTLGIINNSMKLIKSLSKTLKMSHTMMFFKILPPKYW